MQYTEAQMQDMMYIRHLFYYKVGQLARERNALLDKMHQAKVSLCHAADKLTHVTNWSDQLRENGAEEYRVHMQFVTAVFRGVMLSASCHSMHVMLPSSIMYAKQLRKQMLRA